MDGIADASDLNEEAVGRFLNEGPGEAGDHELLRGWRREEAFPLVVSGRGALHAATSR